jgi:hypothetical protein
LLSLGSLSLRSLSLRSLSLRSSLGFGLGRGSLGLHFAGVVNSGCPCVVDVLFHGPCSVS